MRYKRFPFLAIVLSFALACGARASSVADGALETGFDNAPLVSDFDWLSAWGSVDASGGDADFVIPASRLPVKADLKSLVKACISDAGKVNQAQMKMRLVDFNGDGINDVVVDGQAYYRAYSNEQPGCETRLCRAEEGCPLDLYVVGDARQVTAREGSDEGRQGGLFATRKPFQPCPENPEDNTACRAECPASEDMCPALFSYDMRKAWDGHAKRAAFISSDDFTQMAQGQWQGQVAYAARNSNPVLVLEFGGKDMARCGADELAAHGGSCVKYFQFVGDQADGVFADLYVASDRQNSDSGSQGAVSAPTDAGGFPSSPFAMP